MADNSMYKIYLSEYDSILLNNRARFADYDTMSRGAAIEVFRYSLGYYLGWDIYSIRDNLTWDILEKLKLTKFMSKLEWPVELDKKRDFFYIAHLLEPDKIGYNYIDASVKMYRETLEGTRKAIPQNFFADAKAKDRAEACLRYALANFALFYDEDDAYRFFASPEGSKWITKYRLSHAARILYDNNLQFFHSALPDDEKNELLYMYYGIKSALGKVPPAEKKAKQ